MTRTTSSSPSSRSLPSRSTHSTQTQNTLSLYSPLLSVTHVPPSPRSFLDPSLNPNSMFLHPQVGHPDLGRRGPACLAPVSTRTLNCSQVLARVDRHIARRGSGDPLQFDLATIRYLMHGGQRRCVCSTSKSGREGPSNLNLGVPPGLESLSLVSDLDSNSGELHFLVDVPEQGLSAVYPRSSSGLQLQTLYGHMHSSVYVEFEVENLRLCYQNRVCVCMRTWLGGREGEGG